MTTFTKKTSYFNRLQLLFFGLMMPQVTFFFIAAFVVETEGALSPDLKLLTYPALIIGLGAVLVERLIRPKLFAPVRSAKTSQGTLTKYLSSYLISLAILESGGLIACVSYLLTGEKLLLAVVLIVLFMFGALKPGPAKMRLDLELSEHDLDALFD